MNIRICNALGCGPWAVASLEIRAGINPLCLPLPQPDCGPSCRVTDPCPGSSWCTRDSDCGGTNICSSNCCCPEGWIWNPFEARCIPQPFEPGPCPGGANPGDICNACGGRYDINCLCPICPGVGVGVGGPVCGNGVVEGSEACDEGGNNGACPRTCSLGCNLNTCGPACTIIVPNEPLPFGAGFYVEDKGSCSFTAWRYSGNPMDGDFRWYVDSLSAYPVVTTCPFIGYDPGCSVRIPVSMPPGTQTNGVHRFQFTIGSGPRAGTSICTDANMNSCCPAMETTCSDGIDNDCDGLVDCNDGDCGGILTGTVRNELSSPIAFAKVDLRAGLSILKSATTAADGTYSISSNCGIFDISASHTDYLPKIITGVNILARGAATIDFKLLKGTSCEEDCTYVSNNIVHAECSGKNGCSFCDNKAKDVCDLSQPGWIRDYSATHEVECGEGCPRLKTKIPATVTCTKGTLVKLTRVVSYNGKAVKMVVVTCG
ncbi:MAG: carboxypeptidase-like regulatory domain-containing protein [Nanoarchaeota archaeon]